MKVIINTEEPDYNLPLSLEEIAYFMKVQPLQPAEICEQGLLGTWANLGIADGAEWVEAQRQKRRRQSSSI